MTLVDWREVRAHTLAPVYEAERLRSRQMLQWDTEPSWREVEQARVTWGLPGMLVLDGAGRVRGLAFYVLDRDRLDVGGIVSDRETATDALLDGILAAAEAAGARTIRALVCEGAVALQSGLRIRGFDVEPHLYLSRALSSYVAAGPPRTFDAWRDTDIEPAAALLRRAYDGEAGATFAPRNEPAEWEQYVRNLVTYVGCGTMNREATSVLRTGNEPAALALVTDIGPRAAHLAQLAVDPAHRGHGLGRALLDEACRRLASREYAAMTLIVAASNRTARALYDAAGFRHDATFVAATLRRSPVSRGDALLRVQGGAGRERGGR